MLKEQKKSKSIEDRFIVRPPTESDVQDVMEMLEICDLTMMGEIEVSVETLQTEWSSPLISLERNFRVVTTKNGRVIGYGELWDDEDPLTHTWCWCRVHPEFEGQGIGSYLMNWGEKLARQSMHRSPPEARFTIEAGTPSAYQPSADLLVDQGMKLKRHFYTMHITLEEEPEPPQLPENITIRPMRDLDELSAVTAAVQDAFQDHWGYVEQSPENELAFWQHIVETDPTFDPNLWYLAVDGSEIAGMSLCWPKHGVNEQMGWVGTLGVRRPWRRQGVGLALLKHSFSDLYRRGKNKVGLGVDADSLTGATRLYKKAGMYVAHQFDVYEKELRPGIDMATRTVEE
ncbi:MAG: GNAT family N-acetyltransferase [Candidatus Promineifilaceae bacterium]